MCGVPRGYSGAPRLHRGEGRYLVYAGITGHFAYIDSERHLVPGDPVYAIRLRRKLPPGHWDGETF